jgi:hypothetical protein
MTLFYIDLYWHLKNMQNLFALSHSSVTLYLVRVWRMIIQVQTLEKSQLFLADPYFILT